MKNRFLKITLIACLAATQACCLAVSAADFESRRLDDRFTFRVGAAYRMGMSVKAEGRSYSETPEGLSYWTRGGNWVSGWDWYERGYLPDPARIQPGPDDMGVGNRDFDNGFNHMANITLAPDPALSIPENLTWNWSYADAAQRDDVCNKITYTRQTIVQESGTGQNIGRQTTARSYATPCATNFCDTEYFGAFGLEAELDFLLYTNRYTNMTVSIGIGAAYFWGDAQCFRTNTVRGSVTTQYSTRQQDLSYAYDMRGNFEEHYTYDIYALSVPPPPYEGSYSGPGPLIFNTPENRAVDIHEQEYNVLYGTPAYTQAGGGSRAMRVWNDIQIRTEMDMLALWLGPKLHRRLSERWWVAINPRLTLNYLMAEACRIETLYAGSTTEPLILHQWHDKEEKNEWIWGAGLSLGVEYDLDETWFLGADMACDWLSRKLEMDIGPNRLTFDGSAISFAVQMGRRF